MTSYSSSTIRRDKNLTGKLLSGIFALALALGGLIALGQTPAHAAETPSFTYSDATFYNGADYKGVVVEATVVDFTDAEQIAVQVNRENGGPVVKTSKPDASILALINSGDSFPITAPIVIQAGTYNDANSSTWFKPGAVWTPTTVPTSVTITITRTGGETVVATVPVIGQHRATPADVLPTESAPVVVDVPTSGPPFTVDVPEGAEDVSLDLGTPDVDGEITTAVDVVVTTSIGASVTLPANTTISSADPDWDGVIQLPTAVNGVEVPAASGQTATVGVAIELGSPTARIDFDNPVKLVLAGQADLRAGYVDHDGMFHAITEACPATAPTGMTTDECWVNENGDLSIWTTHFTTFVSYEVTVDPVDTALTGETTANATVGTPFTYTPTVTGEPAPTVTTLSTLPEGLSLDATTGVISGTPSDSAGSYPVTLTASNGVTSKDLTVTITLSAGPLETLKLTASAATVGQGNSITITGTGTDTAGNALGDVTNDIRLSSDVATDIIDANSVTFVHASPHTITATHTPSGVIKTILIEVTPAATGGEVTPGTGNPTSSLPSTGSAASSTGLLFAAVILAAGAALIAGSRIRAKRSER